MKTNDTEEQPDRIRQTGDRVTRDESDLVHHGLTRIIIGAFYSVHSQLGAGFLEAVYLNALAVLLTRSGLKVERQVPFEIVFHGVQIGRYVADMIVESIVVVEGKTARNIDHAHSAQLLNYVRASGLNVGLLLNFGRRAEFKRVYAGDAAR